jgi:hypothetical protein
MGVTLDSSEIIALERSRGIVENMVAGREDDLIAELSASTPEYGYH